MHKVYIHCFEIILKFGIEEIAQFSQACSCGYGDGDGDGSVCSLSVCACACVCRTSNDLQKMLKSKELN